MASGFRAAHDHAGTLSVVANSEETEAKVLQRLGRSSPPGPALSVALLSV